MSYKECVSERISVSSGRTVEENRDLVKALYSMYVKDCLSRASIIDKISQETSLGFLDIVELLRS